MQVLLRLIESLQRLIENTAKQGICVAGTFGGITTEQKSKKGKSSAMLHSCAEPEISLNVSLNVCGSS